MKKETRNEAGELHSFNDEPALEYPNGNKAWYQNGERHRLNGPAVEYSDGSKHWYQNGERHRLNGPAVEYPNGEKEYWIEDEPLTEREFLARVYIDVKLPLFETVLDAKLAKAQDEIEWLKKENEALEKEARLAITELSAIKHSVIYELKGLVGNSYVREGKNLVPLSELNYLNRIRHLVKIEKIMVDTMVLGCMCGSESVAGSHHSKQCPVRHRFDAIHGYSQAAKME